MKQYEAVIKVMEDNGGYATLGFLYEHVLDVLNVTWKTKTPFATMRRIVQDDRFFFKIKPGLWALKNYKDKLPEEIIALIEEGKDVKLEEKFTHSYYQGMIVEIGKFKNFKTYIPPQDHNKMFLDKKLKEMVDLDKVLNFTYDEIIQKTKSIDVFWFNDRNFPAYIFEIEHTTDFKNSLLKFLELQDFNINMNIVSPVARSKEFYDKIEFTSFQPIRDKVKFLDYKKVSNWYERSYELMITEKNLLV